MSDNVENEKTLDSLESTNPEVEAKESEEVNEPTEALDEVKSEETVLEEETQTEEKVEEPEVKEEVFEEAKEEAVLQEETSKKEKKEKKKQKAEEPKKIEEEVLEEPKKDDKNTTVNSKNEVEKKIRKQIEKKQEKKERMGIYRIGEYLKEEHKWENWLFLAVSVIVLALGLLILNGSLIVKEDFPLIGSYPKVFAWVLVSISSIGILYALYPFFKPAFPEFKKITWLTMPKFWANVLRVFIFMAIFVGLFILYDTLMAELFILIFRN